MEPRGLLFARRSGRHGDLTYPRMKIECILTGALTDADSTTAIAITAAPCGGDACIGQHQ
jgi:hypothetical protein